MGIIGIFILGTAVWAMLTAMTHEGFYEKIAPFCVFFTIVFLGAVGLSMIFL